MLQVGERLAGQRFDMAVSSDLQRARDTALAILGGQSMNILSCINMTLFYRSPFWSAVATMEICQGKIFRVDREKC